MTRVFSKTVSKLSTLLGAGVLLQASGCDLTGEGVASGLITAVAQNLLQSFVFGAFNLAP